MQNRTPVPRDTRPPLPAFAPVPRKCPRHDGWTPERQRAFIEALADTGSVSTACRMVNMASEGAYALRRHPEAHDFRRAWEAALDMGVQRLKDEAFERAINGQLVPVFVAGKLMGYRRKKNDRLLMFCLRHYGHDSQGKRVTLNYFSSRGSATTAAEGAAPLHAVAAPIQASLAAPASDAAAAERDDTAAATLAAFEGVELDAQAQAQILAALTACAERQRALAPEDDPEIPFVAHEELPGGGYAGELEVGAESEVADTAFAPGEPSWQSLGDEARLTQIDAALASIEAHKALPEAERLAREAEWDAEAARQYRSQNPKAQANAKDLTPSREDEARMDWRNWEG